MDSDRKYRQRGYQDTNRPDNRSERNGDDRPKQPGPRPPIDVTGPRLPRLVQAVTASRCYNCATQLPNGTDYSGNCPKCGAALHCCKQCAHFEPSTRFQCLKPVPVRIAAKDQANECEWFSPRVTVARDSAHGAQTNGYGNGTAANQPPVPRNATDARAAFDSLFKKPE